jgi:cell division protein FtsZ
MSIAGGSDLGLFEINEAARMVQGAVHPDALIIFGAVIDDTQGDQVKVTVIAAGFDGGAPPSNKSTSPLAKRIVEDTPIAAAAAFGVAQEGQTASIPVTSDFGRASAFSDDDQDDNFQSLFGNPPVTGEVFAQAEDKDGSEDDLDIPDFLR